MHEILLDAQQKCTEYIILCAILSKHRRFQAKLEIEKNNILTIINLSSCNSVANLYYSSEPVKLMEQSDSENNIPDLHFHEAQVTGESIYFISALRLKVLIFTDKQ